MKEFPYGDQGVELPLLLQEVFLLFELLRQLARGGQLVIHLGDDVRNMICAKEAFDMIGVSVLSGMVTSVLAALALLTCDLQFFAKFGFLHCVFSAWFCDLLLHIGMLDLTILRFGKSERVGWCSAVGMFSGHYFTWIAMLWAWTSSQVFFLLEQRRQWIRSSAGNS